MLSLDFFLIPCYNIFIRKRKNVPSPGSEATRAPRRAAARYSATCDFAEGERSEPSAAKSQAP